MQIVSGKIYDPTVHYEAPPSDQVRQQMSLFIEWFNNSAPRKPKELPALLRAGIAHLYFESIHPFEDGNGRIGRAISEEALSQSLGRPTLIAISTIIEKNRKDYYNALQLASYKLQINDWLEYFYKMVLDAQQYTQQKIDFLIDKGKFYQTFEKQFNPRQARVVARIFREGVEGAFGGFLGGLSANNYINLTGTSRATATRDLQELVNIGALTKQGERKHTRYFYKCLFATD